MNEVYLQGIVVVAPTIHKNADPGKKAFALVQLRIIDSIMLANGYATNISTYVPLRFEGTLYFPLLEKITTGTEIKVKGRLVNRQNTSINKGGNHFLEIQVNEEGGYLHVCQEAAKK